MTITQSNPIFSRRDCLRTIGNSSLKVVLASAVLPVLVRSRVFARGISITGQADTRLRPLDAMMLDFLERNDVPGASLALSRDGRIVYSRGFGFADRDRREPVKPSSLFRIASLSKPITSAAIMTLVQRGLIDLSDPAFKVYDIGSNHNQREATDPRLSNITVRQLLEHSGGWDRNVSGDPMFMSRHIAHELQIKSPPTPEAIIRYWTGKSLDFDPGVKYAYSNLGYSILGRIIESVTHMSYEEYVRESVLRPLGIKSMQLGRTVIGNRADNEVKYYTVDNATAPSVFDRSQATVPMQYGGWCLESMDAHGGWLASAADLVRFSSTLDDVESPVLSKSTVEIMSRRPAHVKRGNDVFYGLGWQIRRVSYGRGYNAWHTGRLAGTSSILVRRADGLSWAVLFNQKQNGKGESLDSLIDPLIHKAVRAVQEWPK